MYQTIRYEVRGSIARATLNRPKEGNAFNGLMFREVAALFEQIDADHDIRAVLITGEGKHFCTGGDIGEMKKQVLINDEVISSAGKMSGVIRRCGKPVLAMVNGMAAGAGLSLALACDFRIMSEKSGLISSFINMGFTGDTGAIYHLYQMVGLAKTTEIMALSPLISAQEALRLGLATKVVPVESFEQEAQEFVEMLSQRPTAAFARQKQLLNAVFAQDFEHYCRLETQMMLETVETQDHKEALAAFLEKRPPVFQGK